MKTIRRIANACMTLFLTCSLGSAAIAADSGSGGSGKYLSNIKQIDGGGYSGYALKSDGTAWAWGGAYTSLGNGYTQPAYSSVQMHIDHVKQISGGYRHSLMLKEDGTVWSVGGNEHGQLGNGKQSADISVEPTQVEGLKDMIAVAAGDDHSIALCKDGTVWAWGGNQNGQLGIEGAGNQLKPVQVKGLSRIVAISADMYESAALDSAGLIWAWGLDHNVDAANKVIRKPEQLQVPPQPGASNEFAAIAAGATYGTALAFNGTVWMWKNAEWARPEVGMNELFPVKGLKDVVSISNMAAVKSDGTVWTWVVNDKPEEVKQVAGITNAKAVAASNNTYYVLLNNGYVMSWGSNGLGQAGAGVPDMTIRMPQLVRTSIDVYLSGEKVLSDSQPLLVGGTAYVALRGILDQMGIALQWDQPTRSVIATQGETKVVLDSVSGVTTVNGKAIEAKLKPIIVNGRTYVPLRLISEAFGNNVVWDAGANVVHID
ncbi:stalk domain-containing protein [Paenibacillus sp. CCS19]|uniref:stalk domain-containing protein n=1 Tax=Paenibacillus sp. CCS19 TaxID=3158387 RepID=UPI00295F40E8|nr:stalk domain-containing protein [Paenibacillus cellulosilyticus]